MMKIYAILSVLFFAQIAQALPPGPLPLPKGVLPGVLDLLLPLPFPFP